MHLKPISNKLCTHIYTSSCIKSLYCMVTRNALWKTNKHLDCQTSNTLHAIGTVQYIKTKFKIQLSKFSCCLGKYSTDSKQWCGIFRKYIMYDVVCGLVSLFFHDTVFYAKAVQSVVCSTLWRIFLDLCSEGNEELEAWFHTADTNTVLRPVHFGFWHLAWGIRLTMKAKSGHPCTAKPADLSHP